VDVEVAEAEEGCLVKRLDAVLTLPLSFEPRIAGGGALFFLSSSSARL
jgi:hypothetical protein